MEPEDKIKLFGMSLSLVERDLDAVEERMKLDLQRDPKNEKDDDYYPQFTHAFRVEAAAMGRHYELFYCLEKSIRSLIAETLEAAHGEKWWTTHVPQNIQQNVQQNLRREIDSAVSQRSEEEIDYTTFGELGEIVRKNWIDFGTIFSSEKAFTRIMTSLNVLRGPIAHCCPLAQDEVVRLQLTVKDWIRLME